MSANCIVKGRSTLMQTTESTPASLQRMVSIIDYFPIDRITGRTRESSLDHLHPRSNAAKRTVWLHQRNYLYRNSISTASSQFTAPTRKKKHKSLKFQMPWENQMLPPQHSTSPYMTPNSCYPLPFSKF